MIREIKKELSAFKNRIKDTKGYANEKAVPTWTTELVFAIFFTFLCSTVLTLYGIIYISQTELVYIIPSSWLAVTPFLPFLFTFLFMFKFGHFVLKLMILKSYYIQKGLMKLINKLDMYLWKKTGKDSLASSFLVKHPKSVKFIMFGIVLVTWFIMRWLV